MCSMDRSHFLEKNVGWVDRVVRIVIVAVLWIWPLNTSFSPFTTVVMAAIGGILFSTVITQYCPLWDMLGVSTIKGHLKSK
ncbi:MAG: hypothetical protein C7B46_03145 [Sulfobacillus benefaciens]|uniref:Inner membrane protein YgaP-like transmembrane domain-containing protein n=1 Tax=Sulfobacillus benefaciens TaxID=453960 RepID=A0A2T2XKA7_9FIRM|nr:MAG: hypothetical protein C7B46_03145 [Sulfobacillus benefaciens]